MVVIVVEFCTLIKLFIVLKLSFLIVCCSPKFCKFPIVFLELCITARYSNLLEQSAAGMNVIGSLEVSLLPVGFVTLLTSDVSKYRVLVC